MYGYYQGRMVMGSRRILLLMFGLCLMTASQANEFFAKVVAVLDGDTVLIKRAKGLAKVRLAGIDAPEKAQTFGETAKRSLATMVMGRQIKIVSVAVDQYGRIVANISVNGVDVNAEQVRLGMAWEYSRFHNNAALLALQKEAQAVPRGLWAMSDPTPPWEWRKAHPSTLVEPLPVVAQPILDSRPLIPREAACTDKKHCSEMTSCEEAHFYQTHCGVKTLDGDGDGKPCEKLCSPVVPLKPYN